MENEEEQKGHTPGPWAVKPDKKFPGLTEIVSIDGPVIDEVFKGGSERDQANARLIAAAPELLEALERLTELLAHIDTSASPYEMRCELGSAEKLADAAIKKATTNG